MAKASDLVTETLTYIPGDGDPAHVKWGGHTFHANVGKEIAGHPDGTPAEKLNHHLIESAKNNPRFAVGNAKPKREKNSLPKDAKEYRAYMISWMKDETFETPEDLIARFAKDRELQARCEVGYDDYQYLASLFTPKLADLAKACELSDPAVANIWINHGYNQLPW